MIPPHSQQACGLRIWSAVAPISDAAELAGPPVLIHDALLNNTRDLQAFIGLLGRYLPRNGYYVGVLQPLNERRRRIRRRFGSLSVLVLAFDFFGNRVAPRLPLLRRLYFHLGQGAPAVSTAEILGRFVYGGFKVVDTDEFRGLVRFVVKNERRPLPVQRPTHGPLVKLERVGKGGKPFQVYKIRTMHPYSEFIQEYMYERNSLAPGGKIKNDFRITRWGSLLRRYWLDELPMVLNLLKGDMKLVGVRPLSAHYFDLYPEDLQRERSKWKPGLIPPFYADLPTTLEEIVDSERRYLKAYERSPVRTDMKYFWRAAKNILARRRFSA